jgi:uncharacterized protein (TIGR00725 family)
MSSFIIGVMGSSQAEEKVLQDAYNLGRLIAREGWVLLSGGRSAGVMGAVNQGAKKEGGLTIGILPSGDKQGLSSGVDIPILTDMGNARNNINVLSSDVVVACGMSRGTASEIALALKSDREVVLINNPVSSVNFFKSLGSEKVFTADTPEDAINIIRNILSC